MEKKVFLNKLSNTRYEIVDWAWMDKDTFVIIFQDMKDIDGDTFHFEAEYHKDEQKVVFVLVYEYEVLSGEDCIPTSIKREIEEYMLKQLDVVKGMLIKRKITLELSLDIDENLTMNELRAYVDGLDIDVKGYSDKVNCIGVKRIS